MSIQDLVVADRDHKLWRTLRPSDRRAFSDEARALVVMRGEPGAIVRARSLLRGASAPTW
jgi:hypothetical protein